MPTRTEGAMFGAMSGPHATISAWTRDEESGEYEAEFNGFTVKVRWTPNSREKRGFFTWLASRGDDETQGEEEFEEMENAMVAAEAFARDHEEEVA